MSTTTIVIIAAITFLWYYIIEYPKLKNALENAKNASEEDKTKQKEKAMKTIRLIVQVSVLVGGLVLLVNLPKEWSVEQIILYLVFYVIASIAATIWRMLEPDYNPNESIKRAFTLSKRCIHCKKKLPSYFTAKCPHCTADL